LDRADYVGVLPRGNAGRAMRARPATALDLSFETMDAAELERFAAERSREILAEPGVLQEALKSREGLGASSRLSAFEMR